MRPCLRLGAVGRVLPHVRNSLKHVARVLSRVSGTDRERPRFHSWFEALRDYHGTAELF